MKVINIEISDALHKEFKVCCAHKAVSMKEYLTVAISRAVLNHNSDMEKSIIHIDSKKKK